MLRIKLVKDHANMGERDSLQVTIKHGRHRVCYTLESDERDVREIQLRLAQALGIARNSK